MNLIKVEFSLAKDYNNEKVVSMIKMSNSFEWFVFDVAHQNYKEHQLIRDKIESLKYDESAMFEWFLNETTTKIYLNKNNKFWFKNRVLKKKDEVNQNQNFEFFDAAKDDPTAFISKFKIDNQDSQTKFNNLLKLMNDENKKKCLLIYLECSTFDEFCNNFMQHFNEIYYFNLRKLDNDSYEEKGGRLTDFVSTKIKSHQTLYPNTPTETLIKQVCSKLPLAIAKKLLHMPEFELDAFLVKVQILESILDDEKNEKPGDLEHILSDGDRNDGNANSHMITRSQSIHKTLPIPKKHMNHLIPPRSKRQITPIKYSSEKRQRVELVKIKLNEIFSQKLVPVEADNELYSDELVRSLNNQ